MSVTNWLLKDKKVKTSVYHLGRYCGSWKASTYPKGLPSFHFLLGGDCWLDIGSKERIFLNSGSIVFFFRNIPFHLIYSDKGPIEDAEYKKMLELNDHEEGTALLCGFLRPESTGSRVLFSLLPEYIIVDEQDTGSKIHLLFELLKKECGLQDGKNEEIINHLSEAILYYVVSHYIQTNDIDLTLLNVSEDILFSELIIDILENPGDKWSLEKMANKVFMSRSTFIRRVMKLTGFTPNFMLSKLRINKAICLLRRGMTIEYIYCEVGYDSLTGFHRAFRRITGKTPNEYAEMFLNTKK
ncbi:AraC family transcriptional regulator [Enterobacter cloacae]|uniref:AraC family transcriptional regulator n=1 Tax=Enterobacter cloacae TaxID=550 RepID=UPI002FFC8BDD